ncbi:MAG: hypothetical protein LJE68_18625 [Rhodobacter sp.]|nr:hypothetical protein [Rhodobacter sp.]
MSISNISRRGLLTSVAGFVLVGAAAANAKSHTNGVFVVRENLKFEGNSVLIDNKELADAMRDNKRETVQFIADSFKVKPSSIGVDRAGRILIKEEGIGQRIDSDFAKVKNGACGFGC